jgi:hypothetical protein
MATGDTDDMAARIRAVLPTGWFPTSAPGAASSTPVLDGVLTGLGSAWAAMYALFTYAKSQTRIATATGFFLDLIAFDFFGNSLLRRSGEIDAAFQARIRSNIFAPHGTRAALALVLTNLTGRSPVIFEPANTQDTGGYGTESQGGGGIGYCVAGGYGSLQLPFQCFVTAFRPIVGGIAQVAGYADIATNTFPGAGAYGVGAIEYADLGMAGTQVTDAEIDAAIAAVMPAATIAWTRISN